METLIVGRNIEITAQAKEYIEKKLSRIQRKVTSIVRAQVEVSREHTRSQDDRVVLQITLNLNGIMVRGEERAANILTAVDAVVDVLNRRLTHLKGKLYKGEISRRASRGAAARAQEAPGPRPATAEGPIELSTGRVVRTKRFPMKPMSVEEAATQMELLGHDFFLFQDSSSSKYNVLYRRRDGNYGLIEPTPE
ncbi:MAG: ribosome-associated translation inhibitor RaiA [Chloroflexi bacterium]|nr:ribosome-associated translation inhibitor RaiA [Chloroflexota bacterium]